MGGAPKVLFDWGRELSCHEGDVNDAPMARLGQNIQRSPLLTCRRPIVISNLLSGSSGTCESDIAAGGASDGV